jgi:hypothetical protein
MHPAAPDVVGGLSWHRSFGRREIGAVFSADVSIVGEGEGAVAVGGLGVRAVRGRDVYVDWRTIGAPALS